MEESTKIPQPVPQTPVTQQPVPGRGWRAYSRSRRIAIIFTGIVAAWAMLAYIVLPMLWSHYEHFPQLEAAPKITHTHSGIPGDPLNVGLVGDENEVVRALLAAGWHPADPVTIKTSVRIATSVVFDRKYADAPVSSLYLFGRKQDLAFEQASGKSAKKRNHVRFWLSPDVTADKRQYWVGSATYDDRAGLSHTTGQITHHIDPDIDAERDLLMHDLTAAGQLSSTYQVTGVGLTLNGRNGGGDRYYTDGELTVGVISANNVGRTEPPESLPNPVAVQVKHRIWTWLKGLL